MAFFFYTHYCSQTLIFPYKNNRSKGSSTIIGGLKSAFSIFRLEPAYYLGFVLKILWITTSDSPYISLRLIDVSHYVFKQIYALGARRIAVFSAPPIGCVPSQRTLAGGLHRGCADKYNEAAKMFNSKLTAKLDSLNKNLPNSRIVYIDVYNPLLDLIENPENYGKSLILLLLLYNHYHYYVSSMYLSYRLDHNFWFLLVFLICNAGLHVVEKGCCGTGDLEVAILCNPASPICENASDYVFWDSYHPTEAAYRALISPILQRYLSSFFWGNQHSQSFFKSNCTTYSYLFQLARLIHILKFNGDSSFSFMIYKNMSI